MIRKLQQRAIVGGVVAVGVGLALILQNLGLPLGMGGGSGANSHDEQSADTSPDETQPPTSEQTTAPADSPETEDSVPLPDTSRLLTVIVQERHFLWGTNSIPPTPVQPISLEQIAERAESAGGDAQGIRVRIFHVGSALPSAEKQLLATLRQAGVSETDIHFEQRVLELPGIE